VAFVADRRPPASGRPRDGGFDLPPMPTRHGGVLDPTAWDAGVDAAGAQPLAVPADGMFDLENSPCSSIPSASPKARVPFYLYLSGTFEYCLSYFLP
jgi:hypothetical protein